MKKLFSAIAIVTMASSPVFGAMDHDHSSSYSMHAAKKEDMSHKMETLEAKVGGYDVSLDIMTHKDYQKMMKAMKMTFMNPTPGTSHHIAATVRKDGNKIENAVLNLKVAGPDGVEETKAMPYNQDMMFQHTGHFGMSKKGKYQLTVSFKVGNESHQGVVHYEVK